MVRALLGAAPTSSNSTTVEYHGSIDSVLSWQCAVLFILFVIITLAWEIGTALLAFATVLLSGRKAIWLQRIKAEILALGLITLILSVISDPLEKICIPGEPHDAASVGICPPGEAPVFTYHLIHEAHILLFFAAVVHIVVTCGSFYVSLVAMRHWVPFEKNARKGRYLNVNHDSIVRYLGGNWFSRMFWMFSTAVVTSVNEGLYNLMRILFKIRMDDAAHHPEDKLPRHFNFLNVVEQAMEVEFAESNGFSVVLFLFMAIFLFIPREGRGIYALSLHAVLTMAALRIQYQRIAVQLGATSLFDFSKEIMTLQISKAMTLDKVVEQKNQHRGTTLNSPLSSSLLQKLRNGTDDTADPAKTLSLPLVKESDREGSDEDGGGGVVSLSPVASSELPPAAAGLNRPSGLILAARSNRVAPEYPAGVAATPNHRPSQGYRASEGVLKQVSELAALPPDVLACKPNVKLQLRNPEDPTGPLRKECNKLFWFSSPRFMSFIFQLAFVETSLALTLLFYGLVQYGSAFAKEDGIALVTVTIVVDVGMLVYASLLIQPISALVNTVGIAKCRHLLAEIKRQKLVQEEEYEEGLAGLLIGCCFFNEKDRKAAIDIGGKPAKKDETGLEFIRKLADQAGVIAANDRPGESGTRGATLELYKHFVESWILRADNWANGVERSTPYTIECDLTPVQMAFNMIDFNGSGSIGTIELAKVLKGLGTRATAKELEDMVSEVDVDGTDSIDFTEFSFFLVFKFFDADNDGYMDRNDIQDSLRALGMEQNLTEYERLIDYCMHQRTSPEDNRRRIHLAEFVHIFSSTELIHTGPNGLHPPSSVVMVAPA